MIIIFVAGFSTIEKGLVRAGMPAGISVFRENNQPVFVISLLDHYSGLASDMPAL